MLTFLKLNFRCSYFICLEVTLYWLMNDESGKKLEALLRKILFKNDKEYEMLNGYDF